MTMAETAATNEQAVPPLPTPGGDLPKKILYCTFCFKSQHEVRRLIAGPAAVYICDECVELCNEIIAGPRRGPSKTVLSQELPTERLLERLQPIEDTIQGRGNQLQQVVDILRSREVSWAQIGAALGMSRQSAWERFS
jgi:hypothetical protein